MSIGPCNYYLYLLSGMSKYLMFCLIRMIKSVEKKKKKKKRRGKYDINILGRIEKCRQNKVSYIKFPLFPCTELFQIN